jgi:3-oxoacyl-[acyl-carrier protein] reductase
LRLLGRVAIITGAGRNIGEAIAHAFAAEGARVAVLDINGPRAETVAASINSAHPDSALALRCDVTSSAEVQGAVSGVAMMLGSVDVLVNNVGVVDRQNVLELDEADWDRVIATTLKSVFLCTKYAAKIMVDQGRGGRIINIASTSGHRGRADATAYPSAKAGVLNLTRSLAIQLAPHKIRVNSITPNRVLTEAEPGAPARDWQVTNLVGRQGTPQDVASAALFLASEEADFITGADLMVDGGVTAGP